MNEAAKKNLMFISSDDFYLLTYATIIILDCLNCTKGRVFKDYRKIPFIIELITNNRNILILESSATEKLHKGDKDFLFHSYTNGLAKRSETLKILFTLEKKGYISLHKGGHRITSQHSPKQRRATLGLSIQGSLQERVHELREIQEDNSEKHSYYS
ncbi:hypothetical protein [Pseudomonas aeruginosa]|uniref:hypothetical protein n=1 Tax=Pseudomonas aeruginosa TaxID=287 RepID=UPI003CFD2CDB